MSPGMLWVEIGFIGEMIGNVYDRLNHKPLI